MRRYFSAIETSARFMMSFSRCTRCVRSSWRNGMSSETKRSSVSTILSIIGRTSRAVCWMPSSSFWVEAISSRWEFTWTASRSL